MQCRDISPRFIAYLKEELSPEECAQIDAHLAACHACRKDVRVLSAAYRTLARLPVYQLTRDPGDIAEAVAHQASSPQRAPSWWSNSAWAPIAAVLALLVIALCVCHTPRSSRNILARVPSMLPAPARQPLAPPARASEQPATASTSTTPTTPAPARAHGSNARPRRGTPARGISRATPASVSQPPRATPPDTASPVNAQQAGAVLLARQIDAVASSMTQTVSTDTPITCALLPICASDPATLAVADSLTAALTVDLGVPARHLAVNRLPPLVASVPADQAFTPEQPEIAQLGTTLNEDYLIVGSVESGDAGYLLSISVLQCSNNTVVFTGEHPVLLPRELFPPSLRQLTTTSVRQNILPLFALRGNFSRVANY